MRKATEAFIALLNTQYGTEPNIQVEIQWVRGGKYFVYLDELIEISSIDSSITEDNTTDATRVSITLDDANNSIKQLLNTCDLHNRPVSIYLTFKGHSDKLLLFNGVLNSPFTWGEGDRTITFR